MTNLSPIPPQSYGAIVVPQHRPFYKIVGETFYGPDDTLYVVNSIIGWDGEPNQSMEPLNDKAHAKYSEYLKKLDKFGREAAEKAGKAYHSLADAHANSIALAQQVGRQVEILGQQTQVPLMRAKKLTNSVEVVEAPKPAPLMGTMGKLSLKPNEK